MDFKIGLAFALPFAVGLGTMGAGIGLGRAVGSAMDAVGRQPDALSKILIVMATGCAFIESVAIYALVYAFILAGKL
ncbi:MAG TPA: ATP synthase F0 subunit C [Candidatus Omnitrophota bacterium]|nr:ATP synthase F0 subunit C [Candidatus Omnitrophota bacterium]HPS20859.1 ATP synthase F0 subunit C [Candidatus Omnitrophota bacterium]